MFSLIIIIAFIFGLIIGSFLNVVIYRLPIQLKQQWRDECYSLLNEDGALLTSPPSTSYFNLAMPRSHCRHCQQPLKIQHNIPLLSFLLLRGRCAYCQHAISWQYPIIELVTALLTSAAVYVFQLQYVTIFALLFVYLLIVIATIDWQTFLIPDELSIPLIWIGLCANLFHTFTTLTLAVSGAIFGYLLLWIIGKGYWLVRHREGLGHGDYKLLAVIGAWFGLNLVAPLLLLAVILALIVAGAQLIMGKIKMEQPIPFGPALVISALIGLFFQQPLQNFYLYLRVC